MWTTTAPVEYRTGAGTSHEVLTYVDAILTVGVDYAAPAPPPPPRRCTAEGCNRPHLARDMCVKHYRRWSRQ